MSYTKVKPQNIPYSISNYSSTGNNPLSLSSHFEGSASIVDEFSGEQLPGWHLKLRHHFPATTIASGVKKQVHFGTSYYYTKTRRIFDGQVNSRLATGNFDWEQNIPTTAPGDADSYRSTVANSVLSQFLRRAKKKQQQFAAGVFLGELKETLQLIRRPLRVVRAGLDSFVSTCRANRSRKGISRFIANEWLGYQFGIKPFISDIESAVASLVRFQHERVVAKLGFQGGSEVLNSLTTQFVDSYALNSSYLRHVTKTWICTRRIVGEVYVEPNGPIAIQQSWGLGTRDFIPTIYELIPYSFLVDYFLSLGELIEAWSFNQADLAWHNDTFREECVTHVRQDPHVDKSVSGFELLDSLIVPANSFYKVISFTRRSDPLGLPSLEFRLPGLGTKFLNIGALAKLRVL